MNLVGIHNQEFMRAGIIYNFSLHLFCEVVGSKGVLKFNNADVSKQKIFFKNPPRKFGRENCFFDFCNIREKNALYEPGNPVHRFTSSAKAFHKTNFADSIKTWLTKPQTVVCHRGNYLNVARKQSCSGCEGNSSRFPNVLLPLAGNLLVPL